MAVLRSRSQKGSIWDSSLLFLRKYSESILVAIAIGLLTRWLVIAPYLVKASELRPHFFPGDLVVGIKIPFSGVAKWLSGGKAQEESVAKRWTWVVYNCVRSEELCMHQVVGLPGDRLDVRDGTLWVNETKTNFSIAESQLLVDSTKPPSTAESTAIVPPGHIWVIPSRDHGSSGSSRIGIPVPFVNIVAEVKFVFFSVRKDKENGLQVHWDRFLQPVN